MSAWRQGLAGASLLVLALSGCAGDEAPASAPAPPASDLAADDGCRTPDGGRTESWTVDGGAIMRALVVPAAAEAAAGTALVVSNANGATVCDWLPSLALWRPYGTLWLYDYILGGNGLDDIDAVVARARAGGAERVVLVGASRGGTLSLVAAAGLPAGEQPPVVALSPVPELSDGTAALDRSRAAGFPTLLVTAAQDEFEAAPASRALAAARPSVTTLQVVPGNPHGTDLLAGPTAAAATAAVERFLDARR